jgi:hypothetical protein
MVSAYLTKYLKYKLKYLAAKRKASQITASQAVVYIFYHRTITQKGINFYKKLFEGVDKIHKIYFVVSDLPKGVKYTSSETISLKNALANTDFYEQMKVKGMWEPIAERLNKEDIAYEKKLPGVNIEIKETPQANYLWSSSKDECGFHSDGIGAKRFMSQIVHQQNHRDLYYIAIDGKTCLYQGNTENCSSSGRVNTSSDLKTTYAKGVESFYQYIKGKESTNLIYGFEKLSTVSGPTCEPCIPKCQNSYALYKFIFVGPGVINEIFYDPYLQDFKEDVDWLIRCEASGKVGIKNTNFGVGKYGTNTCFIENGDPNTIAGYAKPSKLNGGSVVNTKCYKKYFFGIMRNFVSHGHDFAIIRQTNTGSKNAEEEEEQQEQSPFDYFFFFYQVNKPTVSNALKLEETLTKYREGRLPDFNVIERLKATYEQKTVYVDVYNWGGGIDPNIGGNNQHKMSSYHKRNMQLLIEFGKFVYGTDNALQDLLAKAGITFTQLPTSRGSRASRARRTP